jgi:uncharacterized membrane protein YqjE
MEAAQRTAEGCVLETAGIGPVPPGSTTTGDPGLLEIVQTLWNDLRGLAFDHLQLAALETQRAGKSLVNMVIYAVAAALLLVSAWLALLGAIVAGLIVMGLNASVALLLVAASNIIAAFVLYRLIRRSSEFLRFPATLRSLKSDAAMLARPEGP